MPGIGQSNQPIREKDTFPSREPPRYMWHLTPTCANCQFTTRKFILVGMPLLITSAHLCGAGNSSREAVKNHYQGFPHLSCVTWTIVSWIFAVCEANIFKPSRQQSASVNELCADEVCWDQSKWIFAQPFSVATLHPILQLQGCSSSHSCSTTILYAGSFDQQMCIPACNWTRA